MKRVIGALFLVFSVLTWAGTSYAQTPGYDQVSPEQITCIEYVGLTYAWVRCNYGGDDLGTITTDQGPQYFSCIGQTGGVLCSGTRSGFRPTSIHAPMAEAWLISHSVFTLADDSADAVGFVTTVCPPSGTCYLGTGGGSLPGIPPTPDPPEPGDPPVCSGVDLGFLELLYLVEEAGFTGSARAVAIAVAMAESSGQVDATNFNPGPPASTDLGLWQINDYWHPQYDPTRLLTDPLYNAEAAYAISGGGSDWSAWVAYTNGSYLTYLDDAEDVVDFGFTAEPECDDDDDTDEGGCGGFTRFDIGCWIRSALRQLFIPSDASFAELRDAGFEVAEEKAPFSWVVEIGSAGWSMVNGTRTATLAHHDDPVCLFEGDMGEVGGGLPEDWSCADMAPVQSSTGALRGVLGVMVVFGFALSLLWTSLDILRR